jgi:Gene product 88
MLKFNKGNAKLGAEIFTFSLPAGYACPGARECLSRAGKHTGKIQDGLETQFRCFAASSEAMYPSVRKQRWDNFDSLKGKTTQDMTQLIFSSLPEKATTIRVHVSGDFFNESYFDAWMEVARKNPLRTFYAYTKSLHLWVAKMAEIPKNFILNASRGGIHDWMIDAHKLKSAEVVFSVADAKAKGLEIDHDDTHAYKSDKSFALLIHGTQPSGSVASKALSALKKLGWTGYNKKNKKGV